VNVAFSQDAWNEYCDWPQSDRSAFDKLNTLIEQCRRTPLVGRGKPEPLRGDLLGWWSRRITREDRLVYRVTSEGRERTLEIIQCRSHY
jgi:toxin YoeB